MLEEEILDAATLSEINFSEVMRVAGTGAGAGAVVSEMIRLPQFLLQSNSALSCMLLCLPTSLLDSIDVDVSLPLRLEELFTYASNLRLLLLLGTTPSSFLLRDDVLGKCRLWFSARLSEVDSSGGRGG